jgi:hypothetical protein
MKRIRNRGLRIAIWFVLVVVVISVLFIIMGKVLLADYQTDGTAESAAYNYQLAIIEEDYLRAYRYLSPSLPNRPSTLEAFIEDMEHFGQTSSPSLDPCVWVEGVEENGVNATVMIWEQLYTICTKDQRLAPENLSYNLFEMKLELQDGEWRILNSGEHFVSCWAEVDGCK